MTVLLLVLTALIIAVNGFFVAAEYSLVRSRQNKVEAMARGRPLRRCASAPSDRRHRRVPRRLPGRHHDGLDRHRLPRRAGDREPARGPARRAVSATAWRSRSAARSPTSITDRQPRHLRRAGAEDLHDRARRAVVRRVARPLECLRAGSSSPSAPRSTRPRARSCARWASIPTRRRGDVGLGGPQAPDRPQHGRAAQLDPGEAGMLQGVFHLHEQEARQVMTPIPAVVTSTWPRPPRTAVRRCVDSGHTRLLVTEDDNTDRIARHRAHRTRSPGA